MSDAFLAISLAALVITKLADVWTTIHYVGPHAESNPLARWLFLKVGFGLGLAVVSLVWAAVVSGVYLTAWKTASPPCSIATGIVGSLVALAQLDVARFNKTRRHTRFTKLVLALYSRRRPHWLP